MHQISTAVFLFVVVTAWSTIEAKTLTSRTSRVRHVGLSELIRSIAGAESSVKAIRDEDGVSIGSEYENCEPITDPLCGDILYSYTLMPNHLGHQTQADAGIQIQQFQSLIETQCSPNLHFFVCSIHFPLCTGHGVPVPPCRRLCEETRIECEKVVKEWPERLDCSQFPDDHCIWQLEDAA